MKFTLLLTLAATTTAVAYPLIDISLGTPRFVCPSRVQAFCSASSIHSGCTAAGEFRSDAMDTCGQCVCV
ncbi:Putative protein of unknown function [Podospora comata]|uniref:Uncharacterized protein n=1 Tax=Podospora comata TaxID=48703 RepID=A0ABY6RU10_PODCO|nr:Putative protein of unknown function [Podospora comata]